MLGDPRGLVRESLRVLLSLVLLAGLAIGVYLAWHHDNQRYGDATASLANCPQTTTINCEIVNTSAWSELFGVPIAAYAVPTYLLTLILLWGGRRRPALLAYAFCIGLATFLVSVLLFYVSKTQIGYLCAWCLRLYAVNLSIPVIAALIARRSPFALFGDTMKDLTKWPGPLRFTAGAFLLLLLVTVTVQQSYQSELRRKSAEERKRIMEQGGPTVPASPEGATPAEGATPIAPDPSEGGSTPPSDSNSGARRTPPGPAPVAAAGFAWPLLLGATPAPAAGTTAAAAGATPSTASATTPPAGTPAASGARAGAGASVDAAGSAGAFSFAGPLRRISGSRAELKNEPFDLKARLGHGKPVAVFFWAPGFHQSEKALMEWTAFLRTSTPQYEVYAISGRNDTQRDEEIWETWSMLGAPADVPLLVDDGFKVSSALQVTDVPNLALFSAKGALVIAKIKQRGQLVVGPAGDNIAAEQIVRRVAGGEEIPTIKRMFPYYPAAELFGGCAPPFTLKKFNTDEAYTFSGKSRSGKPTLIIFWSSLCKHCQLEIPQLVKWVKTHPGAVDVVSVTTIRGDTPDMSHRAVTAAYIKTQGIPWVVLEDPAHVLEDLYGIVSTPTTFFVTADGRVTNAWYYAHEEGFEGALTKELSAAAKGGPCEARPARTGPRLDFTVAGSDGKRTSISSLADKPSIVHFWATWCQPCIAELPSLVRLRDKIEKDGSGRVIFVSVEDESAGPQIAKFQKKAGLDLRSYRAPKGGLADKVDLSYRVPRSYLVASGGTLLVTRQGSQDWDDPKTIAWASSRLAGASPPPAAR